MAKKAIKLLIKHTSLTIYILTFRYLKIPPNFETPCTSLQYSLEHKFNNSSNAAYY